MNPDMLHDAISSLPEDLLAPVDALRQKKRASWQPVAGLAACVCLLAGLCLLPPTVAKNSSNGSAIVPEEGRGDGITGSIADQVTQESSGVYSLIATVVEVTAESLIVQPDNTEPVMVQLDALEQVPTLSAGQKIRIFCKEIPKDTTPIVPYRIVIIEE